MLGQYFVRKFIGNLPHSERQHLEANFGTEDSNLQMCFGTLECKDRTSRGGNSDYLDKVSLSQWSMP